MIESRRRTWTKTVRTFLTAWRMAAKRSLSRWKLLSTVVLGVLLASSILSGAVIYFDSLRDIALKAALDLDSSSEIAITTVITRDISSRSDFDIASTAFHESVGENVGWLVIDRIVAGKSPTVFVEEPDWDEQQGRSDARSYFAFFPRVFEQGHAEILPGGSLPRDGGTVSPDGVLTMEAVVSDEAASVFDIGVGDSLLVEPTWEEESTSVNVIISGIFHVIDDSDDVWHLQQEVLSTATRGSSRTIPFYISQETFLGTLGTFFSNMDGIYAWLLVIDQDRISARNAEQAGENIQALHGQLSSTFGNYRQTTKLDNTLEDFDRRIFFSKLPMYVVLISVAMVIVYYVVTISSMVVEERRGEMALLRSRGSSTAQILTVFAMEGAAIASIAVILGPFLAAAAISMLGYTPSFSELTDGSRLVVYLSPGAFALSALGGLLSFMALIIPAVQASRISVNIHRQEVTRPLRLPAFQRYYLDVFLLVVSIILFRQLTEQGSVVATNTLGETRADLLLLALPGLILIAAAMVMLRLFPFLMGLLSRVSSLILSPGLTLGIWQMARNPAHYARLSLLLVLTAGLGIFASSFEATLETNVEERVLYATGSDVRASKVVRVPGQGTAFSSVLLGQLNPGQDMASAYSEVTGVAGITPVLRTRGQDPEHARAVNFEMLAVDRGSFPDVAFFRQDFANTNLEGLLESIVVPDTPQGLPLPVETVALGINLKPDRLQPTTIVKVRLRNSNNDHSNIILGLLDNSDWSVLEVDIEDATKVGFATSQPLTVVSVYVEGNGLETTLEPGSVLIDDIRITTETGHTEIIDRFDDASDWNVLGSGATALPDAVNSSETLFTDMQGFILVSWSRGEPLVPRGMYHGSKRTTLPVLGNKLFYQNSGYAVGDEMSVVVGLDVSTGGYRIPVKLVGTVDLFPTITDADENLLVSEITGLSRYANLSTRDVGAFPMELWVKASNDPKQRQELLENLNDGERYRIGYVQDSETLLSALRIDPLVEAGWNALLILAFSAVLVISCLGFLVHAYVSFRNRVVQFALSRTLGFSMGQLVSQIWVEQLLVIILGIGLGTWMGGRITATIMPFLGHNDWGGRVIPPFVIHVNWGALVVSYMAMFVVFAIISLSLIWLIRRMSLHRVLRLGDR